MQDIANYIIQSLQNEEISRRFEIVQAAKKNTGCPQAGRTAAWEVLYHQFCKAMRRRDWPQARHLLELGQWLSNPDIGLKPFWDTYVCQQRQHLEARFPGSRYRRRRNGQLSWEEETSEYRQYRNRWESALLRLRDILERQGPDETLQLF